MRRTFYRPLPCRTPHPQTHDRTAPPGRTSGQQNAFIDGAGERDQRTIEEHDLPLLVEYDSHIRAGIQDLTKMGEGSECLHYQQYDSTANRRTGCSTASGAGEHSTRRIGVNSSMKPLLPVEALTAILKQAPSDRRSALWPGEAIPTSRACHSPACRPAVRR